MVCDYIIDQFGFGNDEYLLCEIDEVGEKKVLLNGQFIGGCEYCCCIFFVLYCGEKFFMFVIECV